MCQCMPFESNKSRVIFKIIWKQKASNNDKAVDLIYYVTEYNISYTQYKYETKKEG
jgi:hypothetical protein